MVFGGRGKRLVIISLFVSEHIHQATPSWPLSAFNIKSYSVHFCVSGCRTLMHAHWHTHIHASIHKTRRQRLDEADCLLSLSNNSDSHSSPFPCVLLHSLSPKIIILLQVSQNNAFNNNSFPSLPTSLLPPPAITPASRPLPHPLSPPRLFACSCHCIAFTRPF